MNIVAPLFGAFGLRLSRAADASEKKGCTHHARRGAKKGPAKKSARRGGQKALCVRGRAAESGAKENAHPAFCGAVDGSPATHENSTVERKLVPLGRRPKAERSHALRVVWPVSFFSFFLFFIFFPALPPRFHFFLAPRSPF
jgi:hypothetical protein